MPTKNIIFAQMLKDSFHSNHNNMKKISAIMLLLAALVSMPPVYANPDITDLLKGALGSAAKSDNNGNSSTSSALSGLQGLVEGLISNSNLTEADLVGTWQYSKPAVAFKSSDMLKKAGGAAASGIIEEKLTPYYEKVGLNNLSVTFNDDNTFKFKLKRGTLSGVYEKNAESEDGDFIFQFTAVGKIPVGQMNAHIEKVGNKLTMTFDASKLISLVNTVASVSGQSTLQTVATLLNSYDGLNCGFELIN